MVLSVTHKLKNVKTNFTAKKTVFETCVVFNKYLELEIMMY